MPPPLPPGFQVDQPQAAPAPSAGPVAMPQPFRGPPPAPPAWQPPSGYRGTQSRLEPIPGGPADDSPPPAVPAPGDPSKHGEEYLRTISPSDVPMVRALSDGRIPFPTNRALADPHIQQVIAATGQFDPTFDAANYASRRNARVSYTSGPLFQNGISISTAIRHLGAALDASDQLGNWGGPPAVAHVINDVRNSWEGGDHPHDLAVFNSAKLAASAELTRAFRQAGGAEADVQGWQAQLDAAQTPGELHGAILSAARLLEGRLSEQMAGYNRAMGRSDHPITLLSQEAQALLQRIDPSFSPEQPGPVGAAVNAAQNAAFPGAPPQGPTGGPPAPPGGGAPPPQTGPIQFGAGPTALENMPGGPEFSGALQGAIRSGQFHNVGEAMAFAQRLNPQLAQLVNQQDLAAAIRNPRNAGVEVPHSAPPTADISGQRGSQATGRQVFENQINSQVPIIGALTQADQALRGPEAGNALLHGGQDWALFGGRDELAAGMNALLGNGGYDQNIANERGVDAFDNQNHFGDRLAGQVAAGVPEALLPGGMAAQMARGGAQGAAYGFGSGEGDFAQRAPNALLGGTIGAIAPPLLAGAGWAARQAAPRLAQAARWAAGRVRPNVTPEGQAVAAAGAAEKVPVNGPMLDPATRTRMAYLESSLGSGGAVREPLNATQDAIERRVGQISGPGVANETGAMGARVQDAARNFVASSGKRISAIYTRAAQMAGDTPVTGTNAVQTLDQHIADLSQNAGQNAPVINFLRTVRGDLVDAKGNPLAKTVQAFRDMRTNLRGNIDNAGLTHTNADRIMGDVLDAARQDINRDLGAANPKANQLYQRADTEWAGRHAEISQIVDRLVGRADNPLGGGTVMNKVQGLATGDVPRLRRVWSMLGPQERSDLTATIASRAGYKSADEPFSLQQFIAWQRTLPDSAREVIFGAEGAQSIRNLTVLTKALQETRSQLNNSRSGVVQNWRDTIKNFLGGNWGTLAAGSAAASSGVTSATTAALATSALTGVGMLARRASAKALMNPDMSRWLMTSARLTTAQGIRSHIGRLTAIAARDPAIAQEVLGLRQATLRAMNDNNQLGAAAASDQPGNSQ